MGRMCEYGMHARYMSYHESTYACKLSIWKYKTKMDGSEVDSSFMGHYLPNLAKNKAPPMHILDMPQKHTICHMFHHMQNFQSSKCMCIGHKSARL